MKSTIVSLKLPIFHKYSIPALLALLPALLLICLMAASDVEAANMAPNSRFSQCANRTFACIEGSDPKQTFCCCNDIHNNCKKELFCGESSPPPKKSPPKAIQQESCRYLGKQDGAFRNKGKSAQQKCNPLPGQCSAAVSLQHSLFATLLTTLGLLFYRF